MNHSVSRCSQSSRTLLFLWDFWAKELQPQQRGANEAGCPSKISKLMKSWHKEVVIIPSLQQESILQFLSLKCHKCCKLLWTEQTHQTPVSSDIFWHYQLQWLWLHIEAVAVFCGELTGTRNSFWSRTRKHEILTGVALVFRLDSDSDIGILCFWIGNGWL
jgi:hypothetical protein